MHLPRNRQRPCTNIKRLTQIGTSQQSLQPEKPIKSCTVKSLSSLNIMSRTLDYKRNPKNHPRIPYHRACPEPEITVFPRFSAASPASAAAASSNYFFFFIFCCLVNLCRLRRSPSTGSIGVEARPRVEAETSNDCGSIGVECVAVFFAGLTLVLESVSKPILGW